MSTKRNKGQLMINHLLEKGRKAKKAGRATTLELAHAAGIPVGQAYSRLYWMEARQGILESDGEGELREWRIVRTR